MSKILITLFGVILDTITSIPTIQAQQTEVVADTLELDQIVITASKIPLSQRETTKPVILIDRQQIEQSGTRNIGQLLNQQSGIRVNDAYGSPANPQSLFLQGGSASYTLILIDGLAINDPSGTGGTYDLRSIPLDNVEQIEILKGSQSTLYGSDAIAGVVNIITRRPSEQPFQGVGEFSYGSYNSLQASAGLNGTINDLIGYVLNYKRDSSDGFSAATDPDNTDTFGNDGFQTDSFYGKADLKLSHSFSLSPFFNFNKFTGDYDGGAFQDADNEFSLKMVNPGVQFNWDLDNLGVRGGYNYIQTERSFLSQFGEDHYEGRFNNADLFAVYTLSNTVQILGGFNYQNSILPESTDTERFDAQITSPYSTLFIKDWNGISAEAGIRFNSHSEYGSNTTYTLAPAYHLTSNFKVFGSVTSGFKTPTLSELFGPFGANPNLNPQTSRYISGGVEAWLMDQSLKLSALYFDRQIEELIIFTFDSGFINRDRQNDSGFELSSNWIVSNHFRIGAYYNYVTGDLLTLDESGNQVSSDNLIRKPTHSLGANILLNISDNFVLRIDGEFNGERSDLFFNPDTFGQEEVSLDSYTLVNLYAGYSLFNNQATLFTDIRNLFDTDFTEIYGFNTAGMSVKGGVRLNF